jgi:hypothetical protein
MRPMPPVCWGLRVQGAGDVLPVAERPRHLSRARIDAHRLRGVWLSSSARASCYANTPSRRGNTFHCHRCGEPSLPIEKGVSLCLLFSSFMSGKREARA